MNRPLSRLRFCAPFDPFADGFCFEAEGSGGGGGTTNTADIVKRFDGDTGRLAGEIASLEGRNVRLQRDLNAALTRVPAEGSVVLTREQAADWETYRKLGKPQDLQSAVTERDDFKRKYEAEAADNARTQRTNLLREVASVAGYDFDVLADRDAATPGLSYEIKTLDEGGQEMRRAFVKFKDGEGDTAPVKELSLSEFAASRWSRYLPALQPQTEGLRAVRHIEQGWGGTRSLEPVTGATGGRGSVFSRIRERNAQERRVTEGNRAASLEQIMNIGTNIGM